MTEVMNTNRIARMRSVMNCGLERAFLGESVSRKGEAVGAFYCFHADGGDVGRVGLRQAQDGNLAENFAVNLGDEVVLVAGILTPYLTELDGLDCQECLR